MASIPTSNFRKDRRALQRALCEFVDVHHSDDFPVRDLSEDFSYLRDPKSKAYLQVKKSPKEKLPTAVDSPRPSDVKWVQIGRASCRERVCLYV